MPHVCKRVMASTASSFCVEVRGSVRAQALRHTSRCIFIAISVLQAQNIISIKPHSLIKAHSACVLSRSRMRMRFRRVLATSLNNDNININYYYYYHHYQYHQHQH